MNGKHGDMRTKNPRMKALLLTIPATLLAISGCWNPFSPDTIPGEENQYYSPVDSAYKALKNLQYAYVSMDIGHYLDCFRDDFEFHLLQVDWDDYNGDGIIDEYWGLDLEEQFHEAMFSNLFAIELNLSGTSESPWTGDSTGQSLQLTRTFDLKVYTDEAQSQGFRASGDALFICRKDSTGEWYIWQWWDQSEI
jgi:hypothetical protein